MLRLLRQVSVCLSDVLEHVALVIVLAREKQTMLGALLTFLVGCLVLAIVLYVVSLVMGMITLPDNIKQIALIIIGLIGLIVLIILAVNVFNGGAGNLIRL